MKFQDIQEAKYHGGHPLVTILAGNDCEGLDEYLSEPGPGRVVWDPTIETEREQKQFIKAMFHAFGPPQEEVEETDEVHKNMVWENFFDCKEHGFDGSIYVVWNEQGMRVQFL